VPASRAFTRVAIVAGASLLLASAARSPAAQRGKQQRSAEAVVPGHGGVFSSSSARRLLADGSGFAPALDFSKQHGMPVGHLPSAREDVELVGKIEPTQAFGQIVEGQIADLTVHEGFAYLNSWDEPTCTKGGVYVVDIRDPASPREVGFIPARPVTYHGEGAQVFEFDTPSFTGDVLAVNNETCTFQDATLGAGGFDLYDVSDPRNPQILVQGFGDRGPDDGSLTGDAPEANSAHNIRLWEHGGKVYAVSVDNLELHDVDIFDVTNPRAPLPVAEFDLIETFPQIADQLANGNLVLNHDDVVKTIGGRVIMMLSYWDAGYVKLDVTDPANPVYIGDTSFDGEDPLTGLTPPEGNAHQVEFSADNGFLLATDEDFNPYRAGAFSITTGPNAGEFPAQEVGGGTSAASLPDLTLDGPTVYGGYGCNASAPIPPRDSVALPALETGEEAIVVLQRGPTGDPQNPEAACFPGEKAANGIAAGYDAVLLVNRHLGSADLDEPFCGSGGYPPGAMIVTLCTTHEAFHRIFNSEPQFQLPVPAMGEPAIGTVGEKVEGTSEFDGWGYMHLYENGTGKLREVDAFAIEEALDPRFAFGFGDLSVHEFATDPTERLAYSSYYAGGFRVMSFDPDGLDQVGKFIDKGGNNFWGVEQYTTPQGERLVGASDRDFGLYIFRYTGPGAAAAPECEDVAVSTAAGTPVTVPLTCTDANNNTLTLSTTSGPANGTLGTINQSAGSVTYTPNAGFTGTDTFAFVANDGAADSDEATATITVGAGGGGGPCSNPIVGTNGPDLLEGTPGGDLIVGRRGNDRIFGRGGDDCLEGEGGRDRLSGGSGDDRIDGGRGDDRINAKGGKDRVFGGRGDDRIDAKDGKRDRIDCGRGRDSVEADRVDKLRNCEKKKQKRGNKKN